MNRLIFCASLVLFVGCGDGTDQPMTAPVPIEVTADSFQCILDGTKVRKFYVTNLLGNVDDSVAVARGDSPLPYPTGTVIQLFQQEAMVKRETGFSAETNDWEFFFLTVSPSGTEITTRGAAETVNAFGGNCLSCHSAAEDNDLVCETGNGCDPLPAIVTDEFIEDLQNSDPRCQG